MVPMKAADYRAQARNYMSNAYGMLLLIFFIYSVAVSLLSYTGVGTLILGGPLAVGLGGCFLLQCRGGKASLNDLFAGFTDGLANRIVGGLLITLFTFLWSMLFVIPGIIKTYSYAMTYYIMHDNPDMTATEAITRSREMMNGHKWELFCLQFSFIGWMLLGVLACGVGVFFVMPYMQTATAVFYENIKEG